MQTPLRVTFRHCDHSDALQSRLGELVARLERYHDRIIGCHAIIEGPSQHHTKGEPFTVSLEITVPGSVVHVSSDRGINDMHINPYFAVQDAFESAKRQLRRVATAS